MVEKKQTLSELKEQLEALKHENELLKKNNSIGLENYVNNDDNEKDIEISSDTYIKVMSLTPFWLTLTTQEYGRGKKFNFEKFGDVKRILYSDLIDIVEVHQNFLNEGYFIILNKDVVRKLGLDDVYQKILTKEMIDKIMLGNQSDAVNLFKTCNDTQKEFIANMFVEKLVKDEKVDLNLLDRLSRVIGYSISERANDIKQISKK